MVSTHVKAANGRYPGVYPCHSRCLPMCHVPVPLHSTASQSPHLLDSRPTVSSLMERPEIALSLGTESSSTKEEARGEAGCSGGAARERAGSLLLLPHVPLFRGGRG